MPILDKSNKKEVKRYEEFLIKNKAVAMQDLKWAKVKDTWKNEVVYIEENDEIIASMSILLNKVPVFKTYLMYASRGPVCDTNNIDIVNKLVEEAKEIQKKYNAFVLKMDPEIINNENSVKLYKDNGYKIQTKYEKVIQPRHNMVLKIKDKTIEDLMKGFAEKTRYNIRVAIKKGISVRYSRSIEDLKIFYNIYKITTIRDKIGCRPIEYFERMLNAFNENEFRVYIAEHEGIPLAAALALNYGGKMFYIYGASSNEKRNLMPTYLMQYEMIKWGLEEKCDTYDFGGVFEFTNENGLYKFKSGFCKQEGVTEYIGEIDKVYRTIIYFLYTDIMPIFKSIKKSLRKFKN